MQIFFRWRHRQHLDTVVKQGCHFLAAGLTPNAAIGRLALRDLAYFAGKRLADIFGSIGHGAKPRHQLGRVGQRSRRGGLRNRSRVDMGRAGCTANMCVIAHRANDLVAAILRFESVTGCKPALEVVRIDALQIEHDHAVTVLSASGCGSRGARSGSRTRTAKGRGILSPLCLPISPSGL